VPHYDRRADLVCFVNGIPLVFIELKAVYLKMFILDNLYASLPRPPFSDGDTESAASRIYDFFWQRSAAGAAFTTAA
jgi:hypothetical protein